MRPTAHGRFLELGIGRSFDRFVQPSRGSNAWRAFGNSKKARAGGADDRTPEIGDRPKAAAREVSRVRQAPRAGNGALSLAERYFVAALTSLKTVLI
jgi:hypothetical protein